MPGALTTTNPGVLSVAIEMANVHNTLLRGLNAIYLQAPHVHLTQDIADFMLFAATWQDTIHHHHELEETFFFPQANELARATLGESVMDANIDQHRAFEDGLTDMAEFIGAVRDGRRKYDGAALQKCIDRFAPVLTAHLHDEIKTIMRLEKCDGEKIKAQFAKCAQEGAKNVDPVS
jgi:hemerythrin-like domain-containing protein